jgi:glutamate dehydrogenase
LLGLARLRTQVSALPSDGYWQGMAKASLGDDLAALQRELTADVLQAGGPGAWAAAQRLAVERAQRLVAELADTKSADLAMVSVALRELRHLT